MQSNFLNFSNHHALRWLFMLLLLGSTCILGLKAQQIATFVRQPEIHDFAATLSFLASDWFEGREVGTRGGDMAADYVASMMEQFGLQPIGKPSVKSTDLTSSDSYFQDFEIIQYSVNKASLLYNDKKVSAGHISPWIKDVDFEVKAGPKGAGGEGALVFVGYGISDDVRAYDDYEGQDAKGKIAVVINGFPGHNDTTSPAWSRIGKKFKEQDPDDEYKATNARRHGALALIIIDASGKFEPGKKQLADRTIPLSTTNQESDNDTIYRYGDHALPEDTIETKVPYFKMGSTAGRQLMEGTGIDLAAFENTVAKSCKPASGIIKDKTLKFSIAVNSRRLPVRNVLGMLRGTDTTKSIIIGAHYDHLGRRGNRIYHGSDDNASGTAGMLALAKVQAGCREKPACNLIFASWTAEEEGLLGSSHFTYSIKENRKNILLYINMDMISRNAPEDTAKRILSIGTGPAETPLIELAKKVNNSLPHPFTLDLWDVTGYSGSDYASFAALNILVMTYFAGYHPDYHTPRDVAAKADLIKMQDVLRVVNGCVDELMGRGKK